MKYTVTWLPDAEKELAAIWIASSHREAITRAAYEVERRLIMDAMNEGESRFHDMRITFERPVAILFRVNLAERAVSVARVWEYH